MAYFDSLVRPVPKATTKLQGDSRIFVLALEGAANRREGSGPCIKKYVFTVSVLSSEQLASTRISSNFVSLTALFSGGGGVFYRSAAYPSVAFL